VHPAAGRVLYTDPRLASRLRDLNQGAFVEDPEICVLYDSARLKAAGYFARHPHHVARQSMPVVRVDIAMWDELVIRPGEAAAIHAVSWLINTPRYRWDRAPRMAEDLLSTAEAHAHAITWPVGEGQAFWIPFLSKVRHMIRIGATRSVSVQRPPARDRQLDHD
jgi:hypothetical protein